MLVGPLLIGPDRRSSDRTERLVVYIPGDPQQPVKEYASSAEFMVDLRKRLHSASYRRFFSRFVPGVNKAVFSPVSIGCSSPPMARPGSRFSSANGAGAAAGQLPAHCGDLWELRSGPYPQDPQRCPGRGRAHRGRGPQDADGALESFFDAAVSVFNLAAFVVPGLGPIMLAVGASQMCYEVFDGIEAYEQAS